MVTEIYKKNLFFLGGGRYGFAVGSSAVTQKLQPPHFVAVAASRCSIAYRFYIC